LKILITNHHLSSLAGSELLTFELAQESIKQGHEVSVFTLFPGKISEKITDELGVRVFNPNTVHCLEASQIDVIHAHHWPTYLYLKQRGFDKPVVFGFLGVLPPLENPPPIFPTQNLTWWGVSEEVIDNISSIPGWDLNHRIEPIRNWALEIGPVRPTAILKEVMHFGVVSNHFPEKLKNSLLELAVEMGFKISFIGLPDNPKPIHLQTLLGFDAIISLGRTAITSICNGIPTLVLDHSGLDGWVTPDNYPLLRQKNFSGRTKGEFPSKETLRYLMSEVPVHSLTTDLATLASPNHDLTVQVTKILALCELAQDTNSVVSFPKSSFVALEYLERSFHFETERDSLVTERDSLLRSRSWRITSGARTVWRFFRGISKNNHFCNSRTPKKQ
jgi:hypothetical protein